MRAPTTPRAQPRTVARITEPPLHPPAHDRAPRHERHHGIYALTRHCDFSVATNVEVYFCDPQSPWQRGTNENTNRLLRQYFPKGQPIDGFTQSQLNAVARELNERPRQTLKFSTPAEILNGALTG
jgi:IS30 family transposase